MESVVLFDGTKWNEAVDAFRKIPEKFEDSMRLAMKASLRNVKAHAAKKHRFTSRTGQLERSITDKFILDPISGVVFLNTSIAPYAGYVHGGTRAHPIFPKKRKYLRWAKDGDFVFAKRVWYPGTKADPFLYDALEAQRDKILECFELSLATLIKEAEV